MTEQALPLVTRSGAFYRMLYVILFALIYSVAEIVLATVVVIQFIFALVWEQHNRKLHHFAATLSKYIYQILQYATFQSDTRPFPFADWPTGD